jgi:hypothetical protein
LALGELNAYVTLCRILKNTKTTQDLGMADAINDFLQFIGIVAPKKHFLK